MSNLECNICCITNDNTITCDLCNTNYCKGCIFYNNNKCNKCNNCPNDIEYETFNSNEDTSIEIDTNIDTNMVSNTLVLSPLSSKVKEKKLDVLIWETVVILMLHYRSFYTVI